MRARVAAIALLVACAAALVLLAAGARASSCVRVTHVVRRVEHRRVHGRLVVVYHRVRGRRRPVYRMVRVSQLVCPPAGPATPIATGSPAAPAAAAPPPHVRLRAHLDPSFVQDPANPLRVVYSYSASATQTTTLAAAVAAEEPAALPEGVLSLYSDGLLACSAEVGGASTQRECPVAYSTPGAHTVIVQFVSDSTTATETEIEHIEPFATSTSVALSVVPPGTLTVTAVVSAAGHPVPVGSGQVRWCLSDPALTGGWRCHEGGLPTVVYQPQLVDYRDGFGEDGYALIEVSGGLQPYGVGGGLFEGACDTPHVCDPFHADAIFASALTAGLLEGKVSFLGSAAYEPSVSEPVPLEFTP